MNISEETSALRGRSAVSSLLPLVGRVLFLAIFIAAALRHFTREGISHATELGVPLANLLVPLSGILPIAGGLSSQADFIRRSAPWR